MTGSIRPKRNFLLHFGEKRSILNKLQITRKEIDSHDKT